LFITRVAVVALASVALTACGDSGFDAEELVADLNDHGADLELGEPLRSEREGYSVRALAAGEISGGSLTITPDADAGLDEYRRCESSVDLVCFRADNAVLIFERELAPGDQARIADALRAAGSD
jgi:hypothetical protein